MPYLSDLYPPETITRLKAFITANRQTYNADAECAAYLTELSSCNPLLSLAMATTLDHFINAIGPPDTPLRTRWDAMVARLDALNAQTLADFAHAEASREAMLKD